MTNDTNLQQIAHRMIASRMGVHRQSHESAAAAVSVVQTLLNALSPLVGTIGSQALLRQGAPVQTVR